ncbi:PREDICTED: uncharacterized protein LOC103080639 [Lipotes vexillifer]|uniref:Membrane protein BRI3 n=1 Tax=Lipotes vexillifer TaxID=118797 RepID=A0A340WH56_LIPVE|nr:PREDICTED: uncharacterized protein LOC103080639 [Lipotes vexillifer]
MGGLQVTEARTRSPEMEKQAVSPLKERPHDYTSNGLQQLKVRAAQEAQDMPRTECTPPGSAHRLPTQTPEARPFPRRPRPRGLLHHPFVTAPAHLLLERQRNLPGPPSSGSRPPPRGISLKPAMSTVQGAVLPTGLPTHHPRVYNIHSRNVTRYPANSIVVVGGCPVCRVGVLEDSFTFLGIFLAIVLFPFGFICCFALRKRRCPNCGANFT